MNKVKTRHKRQLEELGKAFQGKRELLGWNFTDLKKKSGISKVTLSQLERGMLTNASFLTLSKIAESLGMRITIVLNDKSGL